MLEMYRDGYTLQYEFAKGSIIITENKGLCVWWAGAADVNVECDNVSKLILLMIDDWNGQFNWLKTSDFISICLQ